MSPFMSPQNGSAKRLAKLFGMDPYAMRLTFKFVNLLPYGPWNVKSARNGVDRVLASVLESTEYHDVAIVLLGRKVAEAFRVGHSTTAYYKRWSHYYCGWWMNGYVVPHPSGRNRLWNNPAHARRTTRLLRRLKRWALSSR